MKLLRRIPSPEEIREAKLEMLRGSAQRSADEDGIPRVIFGKVYRGRVEPAIFISADLLNQRGVPFGYESLEVVEPGASA